jgi:alpha-beta hydrolase superfamily lysophospholipase
LFFPPIPSFPIHASRHRNGTDQETAMEQQQLSSDGATLALRVYTPEGLPRASVVIGGAMGVRQAFYEAFATWLAGQGYRVTSFDYRGHGDSLQGPVREVHADLCDWARDYEAVIAHAKAQLPDQPLFLVGHSLGAQLPGLLRTPQRVDGLLSIAAGSGYWRDNAPRLKRVVPYFWHVLVPVATRLCGYFPGRRLRKVGDLARHRAPVRALCQCPQPHRAHRAPGTATAAHRAFRLLPRRHARGALGPCPGGVLGLDQGGRDRVAPALSLTRRVAGLTDAGADCHHTRLP